MNISTVTVLYGFRVTREMCIIYSSCKEFKCSSYTMPQACVKEFNVYLECFLGKATLKAQKNKNLR